MSEFSAESIAVGFLITWGIGLVPPFVVRYLIARKPLGKWPAISVCVGFWFFNFFLFTILGSTSKSHSALILVAAVSYWLLTRRGSDASVSLEQSPPEVPQTLVTPTTLMPQAAAVIVPQVVDNQATTKKVQAQMIEGNADIEDMLYERIGNELASGKPDTATWTKSFAQASGDENRAKAIYINLRFNKLMCAYNNEHNWEGVVSKPPAALEEQVQGEFGGAAEPEPLFHLTDTTNDQLSEKPLAENRKNDHLEVWFLMAVLLGIAVITAILSVFK